MFIIECIQTANYEWAGCKENDPLIGIAMDFTLRLFRKSDQSNVNFLGNVCATPHTPNNVVTVSFYSVVVVTKHFYAHDWIGFISRYMVNKNLKNIWTYKRNYVYIWLITGNGCETFCHIEILFLNTSIWNEIAENGPFFIYWLAFNRRVKWTYCHLLLNEDLSQGLVGQLSQSPAAHNYPLPATLFKLSVDDNTDTEYQFV